LKKSEKWFIEQLFGRVIGGEVKVSKWFIPLLAFFSFASVYTLPKNMEKFTDSTMFVTIFLMGAFALASMVKKEN